MQQINTRSFPILPSMENKEILKNKTTIEIAIHYLSANLFKPGFRTAHQEDIKRFVAFLNEAELSRESLSEEAWKACQIFRDAFPHFSDESQAKAFILIRGANKDFQQALPRNCILMRSPEFRQQLSSLSRHVVVLKPSDGVDYREESVTEFFIFLKSGKISANCNIQTLGDLQGDFI